MSVEDITFKLSTDEAGAVNGFKRFRAEILNNEKGLERVAKQGKMTSTALKDAANVLGPEFQILGDRIDHITGAMADFNGASLVAKASLLGLVAVGSWEVGTMLGKMIAGTEEWKRVSEEAIASITQGYSHIAKIQNQQFEERIELIKLAATENQKQSELTEFAAERERELTEARFEMHRREADLLEALNNDLLGFNTEDNEISQKALDLAKEKVKVLEEQVGVIDELRFGGQTLLQQEIAKRKEAAELAKKKQEEKIKERETRIEKPREQKEQKPERSEGGQIGTTRAEQQRFITRGPGMKLQESILAEARRQTELAEKEAKQQEETNRLLWQLKDKFPDEVFNG